MAGSREEKGHFGGTDQQQERAQQPVYAPVHGIRYYTIDSDEEEEIVSGEAHRQDLRQLIYPAPQWEYTTAGRGHTNIEARQHPTQAPYLLSPYDDSDDSDESYYDTDDVELFMRRHELMGRQAADKLVIPEVDSLSLLDRQEESDLEQAIKLSLEEFTAKEKMEKIKLEQEKKKQEEEKIREEIVKNYEGLLQQKENKPTKLEPEVDSDVVEYQFFCEEPAEGSDDGEEVEEAESDEAVYYSDD